MYCEACPLTFNDKEIVHFTSLTLYSIQAHSVFVYLYLSASRMPFIKSISNSFLDISIDFNIFLFFRRDFHKSFLSLSFSSILYKRLASEIIKSLFSLQILSFVFLSFQATNFLKILRREFWCKTYYRIY